MLRSPIHLLILAPVLAYGGAANGQPAAELRGHSDPVVALRFSPDGRWIVSVSKKGEAFLWELGFAAPAKLIASGAVPVVGFAADGKSVIVGDNQQTEVWSTQNPASIAKFQGEPRVIANNGGAVVTRTKDKVGDLFNIWDVGGRKKTLDFRPENNNHGKSVFAASPDGKVIAYSEGQPASARAKDGKEQSVRLFDVAPGKEREPITGMPRVDELSFAADGSSLACVQTGVNTNINIGTITVWNVADAAARPRLEQRIEGSALGAPDEISNAKHLLFAADGKTLYFGYRGEGTFSGYNLAAWDLQTRKLRFKTPAQTPVSLPDARTAVVLTTPNPSGFAILDSADGAVRRVIDVPEKHSKSSSSLIVWPAAPREFSPDGKRFAYGSLDGSIQLPSLADESVAKADGPVILRPKYGDKGSAPFTYEQTLRFTTDDKWLVTMGSLSGLGGFYYRNTSMISLDVNSEPRHFKSLRAWYLAADGKSLRAYCGNSAEPSLVGEIEIDLATGRVKLVAAQPRMRGSPQCYARAISPDKRTIVGSVSLPGNHQLVLLDKTGLETEAILYDKNHPGYRDQPPEEILFSLDGKVLAARLRGNEVRLWEVTTRKELPIKVELARDGFYFAGDSRTLAAVDVSGRKPSAYLYDVEAGQMIRQLDLSLGHTGRVKGAAFSRVAPLFTSFGENGTVLLKKLDTGEVVRRLSGHKGPVWSAAFSHDGKRLATTGEDETIRIWSIEKP